MPSAWTRDTAASKYVCSAFNMASTLTEPTCNCFFTISRLLLGHLLGIDGGLDRLAVRLQRAQRVRDVLERGDDRLPILGLGLRETRFRRLLFVEQREAVEHRLRDAARQGVKPRSGREKLRVTIGRVAVIGAQGDIGQTRGESDADLRARRMHIGFRRAHVGPLPDELAGRVTGKSRGSVSELRWKVSGTCEVEYCPASAVSKSRCCASDLSSGGSNCITCASAASCVRTSA